MNRKIVTPIIIAIIVCLYFSGYLLFCVNIISQNRFLAIILVITFIVFNFAMIKVTIERIKEIKNGENDDISKY